MEANPTTGEAAAPYELPSRQFFKRIGILGTIFGVVCALLAALEVNPLAVVTEFHHLKNLAADMFPPRIGVLFKSFALYETIGETISTAFLGTLMGGGFALAFSFFAAANTAPSRWVRAATRGMFSAERAVPEFATMLIIIAVIGVGPFTATLAISIASIGLCGRLLADSIENVDRRSMEGLDVVGSSRWQAIRYGIIPQVAPAFVSTFFYAFDVNLRRAIVLGYFGGGGLGFHLGQSSGMLNYKEMLAYTLCIIVLVLAMERVSDFVRRRILGLDSHLN